MKTIARTSSVIGLSVLILVLGAGVAQALAPANDNFSARQTISGVSGSVAGSNVEATLEASEPCFNFCAGATVWFQWSPASNGTATLTTTGSSYDTTLSVWTGASMGTLVSVVDNNDASGTDTTSRVVFEAVGGTAYKISVGGYDDGSTVAQGSIALNWSEVVAPANDDFANAQAISSSSGSVVGTNVAATVEPSEPCFNFCAGRTVWYAWTAPPTSTITFDTFTSAFDTTISVWTGSTLGTLTSVVDNNDYASGTTSRVTFSAVGGTVYRISVGGYDSGPGAPSGSIALHWATPAANDNFSGATALIGTSGSMGGNNSTASKETNEPDHAGVVGGVSLWYSWTAPSAISVEFDTAGSGFNTLLAVYTGNAVDALTSVASNDDFNSTPQSKVVFCATAGTVYRIVVDGFGGATGAFTLGWSESAPTNDNFSAASTLVGGSGSTRCNSTFAGKEASEPDHAGNPGGKSVWYSWTAPGNSSITFETSGSAFNTTLAVYTGSAVSALTPVVSNNNSPPGAITSSVTFSAVSGTPYRIAVDGYNSGGGAASGRYTLSWYTIRRIAQETGTYSRLDWRQVSTSSAYGSSYKVERSAGAFGTFVFTGTSVTWFTNTGPANGKASVTIDGVSKGTFNQYAPANHFRVARTFVGLASRSHTLKITVLGLKGSSSGTGTLVAIDAMRVGSGSVLVTPSVKYTWRGVSTASASGSRYGMSDLLGSASYFSFTGTRVDWYTVFGPNMGKAQLFVDGVLKGTYDNYASAVTYGARRTVTGLSNVAHTAKVVVLQQKRAASTGYNVATDSWVAI